MDWTNASSVATDVVLSQTLTTYDPDGNQVLVEDKERFDSDALCGESYLGDLGSPSSGLGRARLLHGLFLRMPPSG